MPQTFSSLAHLIRKIWTKFIIFKQNRPLRMWKYHQFVENVKFIFWTFGRFLTVWTHSAAVAFGSERSISEIFTLFITLSLQSLTQLSSTWILSIYKMLIHHFKAFFLYRFKKNSILRALLGIWYQFVTVLAGFLSPSGGVAPPIGRHGRW